MEWLIIVGVSVLWLFIGFCLGFSLGIWSENKVKQKEAVRHGHAMWEVDVNGKVKFNWKAKGDA